ncbi:MAG: hypothetical protein RLY86_3446 [Pseudomonadota bacterium]
MNHAIPTRAAFRLRCLIGAAAVALAAPLAAQAQQATTETQQLEEIVVTGSRIQRPNLTAPTPVQVINEELIQLKGTTNAADLINELPAAGVPGVSATNSNFFVSATGLNLVDLRNLGTDRTLVLVNGRRHVGGQEGSTSVDLNSIPADFIERVEVVTGGASAVYGSEAIAGVVNIILKRNFEGVTVAGQAGITGEGDGENYNLSSTIGANFEGDRGNVILNVTYDKTEEVASADRDISATDAFYDPATFVNRNALSSFGSAGRFILGGSSYNPDGTLFNTAQNGYNRNQDRLITVPIERNLLSGIVNYEVFEGIDFFVEGTYARTETRSQSEPIAFGNNTAVGTAVDAPVLSIPTTNPFIPAALRALIPAGTTEFSFARRFDELGLRRADITRQTYRIATGLEGELENGWNWEAYYQYGTVTQDQVSTGVFNTARMQEALNAEVGPGGAVQCASPLARAQGCVPINIFGAGAAAQDALSYITANSTFDSTVRQNTAGAFLSGDVFELPAGAVGFAAGAEYRKEESEFRPDALSIAGISSGNASAPSQGDYDVWEVYGETSVPILAGLDFVDYLGVDAAVRYADYSTVGSVWSYKAGAEYAPVSDLRLRATYARAVRAPNIGELFQPAQQTFSSVTDPCADDRRVTADATTQANCLATPGVGDAIRAGGFQPTQLDLSSIPGFNAGNLNLQEEKADTLTVGAVWTPSFLDGFALTIDYWDIEINDAIQGFDRQTAVDQCVGQSQYPNNPFCALITRNPTTGLITGLDLRVDNVAVQTASGIDLEANYDLELADLVGSDYGSLTFNLIGTYLIENENVPFSGAEAVENKSQVGYSEFKWNLRTTWNQGPLTFTWLLRYIGEAQIDPNDEFEGNDIPALVYNDIQLRYAITDAYQVFAGVDNVLDRKPPIIPAPFGVNITGTETAADVYDPVGRFFYAGFRAQF